MALELVSNFSGTRRFYILNHFDETIWNELLQALNRSHNTLWTLAQKKKNVVNKILPEGLLVTTKSSPQLVMKEWIVDAWNVLSEKQYLTAEDIPGSGRHRSSFILAFLALLPYVTVNHNPLSLTLGTMKNDFNSVWIFQGNPKKFDIDAYIQDRRHIWWSLRQKHFEKDIRVGDEVFLWRTDAGQPGTGGIIARGIISGSPMARTDEEAKQFWHSEDWSVPGVGIPIELQEIKLFSGFLSRPTLLQNERLKDLLIFRMANQTNYKLEKHHAEELRRLWGTPDISYADEDEEGSYFPEGKRAFRTHRIIERNPHLIKAAKQTYKEQHGELRCMVCDFSFYQKYGEIGEDFIEGHHITPVSEISGEYQATIKDIALVCSNCHRMLHRKRPWITLNDLKGLLKL
jgi:predicted RNA-binding protein with PUA-like domain